MPHLSKLFKASLFFLAAEVTGLSDGYHQVTNG